ncbi:MAG: glycosyl hydrolase [Acidobacteriaceae bacterium]|nr:glycosyl hydrolase [Acidobacteriaceae bacterium]
MKLFVRSSLVLIFCLLIAVAGQSQQPNGQTEKIAVNALDQGTPLPHFWEQMFGSGQAILALRDSYRKDLRLTKENTEMRYVRFHDIFGDQVGVYTPDRDDKGAPAAYNFTYVDQIYDGLLAEGVRPFVELSFMPQALAEKPTDPSIIYVPNRAPPKDYAVWDDMIEQFARHLVSRYGIDEVSQWYFEVWNEPDYGFPDEYPKQATYYKLYDHTARALKKADPRLRVGGPATSSANWVTRFLKYTHENQIPIDFVATHIYGDGTANLIDDAGGAPGDPVPPGQRAVPRNQLVCADVAKVHKEIEESATPHLPFILSEFNASWMTKSEILDTVYMGPWMADTVRQCDGNVDMMSYWTFSDVFEEEGVARNPFHGGFGLIATGNIPKPSFNAFALLHKLGDTRLHSDSESSLVTRRKDGTLVIALWNYAEPAAKPDPSEPSKTFELAFAGIPKNAVARVSRLDETHGNVLVAYDAMGKPSWPTREQTAQLQAAAKLAPPERMSLSNGRLKIEVPPRGLVLLEVH